VVKNYVVLGLLMRFVLVFSFPNWSDDVYRFIWDGRLMIHGINPYAHLPNYYHGLTSIPSGLTSMLYSKLNSPIYTSIYPPVAQAVFWLATAIAGNNLFRATIVMKLCLFAADCGSMVLIQRLLKRLNLPPQRILIFALNPLLIMEVMGNLHFEGLMIFFLLMGISLLFDNRFSWAAAAWAAAIGVKLLPLIFMPFFIRAVGWPRKSLDFFAITAGTLFLLFAPFLGAAFWAGFGSSLNLYFQKFEFNASIYYVLCGIGKILSTYNLILFLGPALGVVVLTIVIKLTSKMPVLELKALFLPMLVASAGYLFLSTTVHPWYISVPLVLSIFTPFRFVVIWSGLAVFSYSHYIDGLYVEKYGWIASEYLPVFLVLYWEWRRFQMKKIDWPIFGE
jgi:hypothetical protein